MNIRIINLKGQKKHVWKAIINIDNRKLKIIIWVFGCSIFENHILLSNLALCCIFRSSRAMSLSMILFCISSSFWFSDARNKESWPGSDSGGSLVASEYLRKQSPNQEDTYMMRLLMGEQEISDVKRRHYVHCIHCRTLNGQGFDKSTQHFSLFYINKTMQWNSKIGIQSWNLCIFA